jgi:hypothetical protein
VRTCRYPDGRVVLVDTEPTSRGTLIVNPKGMVIATLPRSSARRSGDPGGFVDHASVCRTTSPWTPLPRR